MDGIVACAAPDAVEGAVDQGRRIIVVVHMCLADERGRTEAARRRYVETEARTLALPVGVLCTSHWPPNEPVYPATVVARLDQVGWTAGTYRLVASTRRHALVTYTSVHPERVALLDLADGHEVSSYTTEAGGLEAFRVLWIREQLDEQGGDQ